MSLLSRLAFTYRERSEFAGEPRERSQVSALLVRATVILVAVFLVVAGWSANVTAAQEESVDFSRDVLPILSNNCFVCHGPDAEEDMLRLDSLSRATEDLGGYLAINQEHPESSELLKRILSSDDPMPPADAEQSLSDDQRRILERWIRQGGEYQQHWAFVPPEKAEPRDGSLLSDVIDDFVERKLASKSVSFAEEADRETLARRAALTLTGLPPEPTQLREFLDDESDGAYERLVDSLLSSERFGENQARFWLDAVRYGDTHGLHLDNRRGVYPYRDWVIFALNHNLPLNDFITWQLAGDLLPNPGLEQMVATGFVRMNPSTSEGGVIAAEFQAKNNFDRTETLGTVFLGMTFTCARCHTHKYDPIVHDEYYRLFAFFNSTQESPLDGNKYDYAPTIKAPRDLAGWKNWAEIQKQRESVLAESKKRLDALNQVAVKATKQWESAPLDKQEQYLSQLIGPIGQLREQLEQFAALQKEFTTTLVAQELAEPRETRLLSRGEYDQPVGEPLQPDVPAALGSFPIDAPRNRLGLAQWLTSRENPLVARVLVNRLWQQVFADGLVRTPEDFGLQGEQPTHPKLLDWLAVELHDCGWDLKHMLRQMVLSKTFRQSSAWRSGIDDPENLLFARGPSYRLDAEVIRDVGLWSSGLLDSKMGGEGVKPYQPSGMWSALAHPASNTKKYERDSGQKLYRRSIYVYWKRTSPHPMMTLFDAPSRESSCVRRSRTNTSLQSLGLFNETQRVEMSRKLAERLLREATDDNGRISFLVELLACRQPIPQEKAALMKLLKEMRLRYSNNQQAAVELVSVGDAERDEAIDAAELAAWTQLTTIVLASDLAIMLY